MGPVDVVVVFYRQEELWPLVMRGLWQNRKDIENIIIVNDEEWPPGYAIEVYDGILRKLVMLDHPHEYDAAAVSTYQGMEAATTEYVCCIDGDIVLHKGSLSTLLEDAKPGRLLGGLLHSIPRATTLEELANPPIIVDDPRLWGECRPEATVRAGYTLCRREDYFAMGGHDRTWPGYGCLDWDFNMRWMMRFGRDSLHIGKGEAYHLGIKKRNKRHPECNKRYHARLEEFKAWSS
jgi:glycosyltransferase involved in cell wall biosynthesis